MLALFGGKPIINKIPNKYSWFLDFNFEELKKIISSSSLSGFLANPNEFHYGGEIVRRFEESWKKEFKSDFAIGFNSWTSGLEASIAALDLPRESEIIVPAWTMSATVASIVINNLTPRFVDVSLEDFNLDVKKVESSINPRTSAIMGVDIFGKPCKADELRKICDSHGLKFIVDAAQTPKARVSSYRSTHYADIGGYSLNRHKHLQVGEGGIAVTNSQIYAERMALYRNHAEVTNLSQDQVIRVGHNLRIGEIEALLGDFQISKLDQLVDDRRSFGKYIINGLRKISWLILAEDEFYTEHDFYILGMRINLSEFPISRDHLIEALLAEGLTNIIGRYAKLHMLKSFQKYPAENMENTEELYDNTFIGIYLCGNAYSNSDLDNIIEVFDKIDKYKDYLLAQ